MKWIEALIEDGRLHHDGDPVLTWAVANVTAREFADGTVMPRKERPENKIDPLVALVIAMAAAMESEGPQASVYESRGLMTLA
jgi:phage terminase large subunit-like protein